MKDNKVLATVEDRQITQGDVDNLLANLGPQRGAQFNSPEGKKRLLDELIAQELFYIDAIKNGLDKEEEFNAEVEGMKENLLKQYAVKKCVDDVQVTEEEAFEYYKQNRSQFKTQEQVRAKHILVESQDEATQIYFDLKKGLFFEEAAKKYSKCPSAANGGDLDYFSRGSMVPEFENAVFDMEVNDISRPVKTQFGYHIIKLVDKKKAGTRDFDDVKGAIIQELVAVKQSEKYMDYSNKLRSEYAVKVNG